MSRADELRYAQEMEEKFRKVATAEHPENLSIWQFWQNRVQLLQNGMDESLRDNAGPLTNDQGQLLLDSATPKNVLRSDIQGYNAEGKINFQADPIINGKKLPGGADKNMAYDDNLTLQPGTYIRYGGDKGTYLLPLREEFLRGRNNPELRGIYEQMGLPYVYNPESWNLVHVHEPIEGCKLSVIGDQKDFGLDEAGNPIIKGGLMQYELPGKIDSGTYKDIGDKTKEIIPDYTNKMTMTRLPPRMILPSEVDQIDPPPSGAEAIDDIPPLPFGVGAINDVPPTLAEGKGPDDLPPPSGGAADNILVKQTSPQIPSRSSNENVTVASGYQSAYADRIRQTPSLESKRWAGERGESICAPQSDAARQILEERGMSGVTYHNGVPDFSPFSESTVKLGYMTDARHSSGLVDGRDSKNTVYAHFEDGELVSSSHRADKGSMADLHMKYDKPGNFEQADALTAEQWTTDGKDGREWTADDVAQYRKDNGLTWHECNDMETMQMVPEAINTDFGHLGGVAEVKETQRIIDEALSQEDDGNWLDGEDFERMSKEELESFNRENGHYDDEGIWIPDEEAESEDLLADKAEEIPLEPMIDKPEELPLEPMIDEPENDSSDIVYDKVAEESVGEPAEETIDEPAEEPVEEPVDEPAEEPDEEPIDEPAEEPDEEPIDEPTEEPVDEPINEPAEEPVEEPIDEPAEEPDEEPIDEPAEEPVEKPIDEPAEEPVDEPINEPAEEPVEEPIDEPAEEPDEEPIDEPTEEPVEEPIDEPVEEPVDEPIDGPAEEPVEEPIDEPAEEPVEEPIDEPTEEPVEELIDEPAEEPVGEPIDETAEEPMEEPIEEPINEPVEEPVDEPIDEPAEEPVEEPIDEPVEEPVDEPIDEPAEEPVEEPVDEPAEEPIDEPVDEPAEEPVEEPIDEPVEEPVEEPIDEPAEETAEEPIDEPIDEPAEEPVEEPIDEPAEESVDDPIDDPAEEPADDFSDIDESSESSDITGDYTDLSDENDDIPEDATNSFDDLNDEEAVDEYDTSENYSDLSDDVNDDFVDDTDYSDYSDDVVDEPMDSSDYADISDDVDSGSYDDSAFDSGDVSIDSGDSGSFDGGGDSID